jgi:hypothetical protein
MSSRHILVIGSQCEAIRPPLSFLPGLAQELFRVMIDPEIGACSREASRLVVDPTVDEVKKAIKEAFAQASQDEATLVLAFIGHGQSIGDDFYLQVRDSPAEQVDDENAVHLVNLIRGQHRIHSNLDGLVVLIDACYSGAGARGAAGVWVRELSGTLRFEVLTAASDRPAYDGCFTRALVDCMTKGMDSIEAPYLYCRDVCEAIREKCPRQEPQLPSFNASNNTHFLAANWARARMAGGPSGEATRVMEEVQRLTNHFQPTPVLAQIVARPEHERGLALVGVAGVGKSALAAALSLPEVTEGIVPAGFVQAVAFFSAILTTGDLAETLAAQSDRNVPGFAQARLQFSRELTRDERRKLDRLQREVIGPLNRLASGGVVRIVLDGLDQIPTSSAETIQSALDGLAAMPHVRLTVTARPDTPQPGGLTMLPMDFVEDEHILSYLERRRVPKELRQAIIGRSKGNWLVAKLLADQALTSPGLDPASLPAELSEIYAQALRRAGAKTDQLWRDEFRPLLGVLAAAGVGPILPSRLLCAASGRIGGPDRPFRVRDRLIDLRGLIVHDRPGTDEERVGLFHQTLVDWLFESSNSAFGIDPLEPHRALAEAIAELAPAETHNLGDPVYRYAMDREVEHLWAIGEHERMVVALSQRGSATPAENLKRWSNWARRIQETLGSDHRYTLASRYNIASWTGRAGHPHQALRLFRELLRDQSRVQGPDDPDTQSRPEMISLAGLVKPAMRWELRSCSGNCCRTNPAFWDQSTLIHSGHATPSPYGPYTPAIGGKPYASTWSSCPTEFASRDPSIRARS